MNIDPGAGGRNSNSKAAPLLFTLGALSKLTCSDVQTR